MSERPPWLRALGLVALLSLTLALALPLWVLWGGNELYESRLPSYHLWLGAASVIHLATVAAWVLLGEKGVGQPTEESV